jgi:predicted DNA-binding protein
METFKRGPRSKKYQYNVKITGEMRARLTRMKYDRGVPKADMIRKWIKSGLDELEKKRDLEPITDEEIEYWMEET